MDSEERHELKENELAEFFSNFGEWWEKYGNIVLLVLVLGAGSFAGYRLYNHWTYGAQQAAFGELAATSSVQGYALVAEEHRQPTVRSLAYLRGGDLALDAAVRPQDEADEDNDTGMAAMSRDEALDRAQAMYSRALETARQAPFRVNALIGLAQVAETRDDWEQAVTHYREAEQLATDAHLPGLARQANQRQALIEQLRQPVVFAPESAAPELPDLGPTGSFLGEDGEEIDFGELLPGIDADEQPADTEQPGQPVEPVQPDDTE
ncbi:hypothetical protein ACERK3_00265 [Phycisphaerales bacterium AB-hyl4]|uniref:Tetratricopeptide repeat protein n=1 Tax=Natronomicrosphaera hydrolytica TaxID=3242702 RepID=A0ABV4U1K6_9BACT